MNVENIVISTRFGAVEDKLKRHSIFASEININYNQWFQINVFLLLLLTLLQLIIILFKAKRRIYKDNFAIHSHTQCNTKLVLQDDLSINTRTEKKAEIQYQCIQMEKIINKSTVKTALQAKVIDFLLATYAPINNSSNNQSNIEFSIFFKFSKGFTMI